MKRTSPRAPPTKDGHRFGRGAEEGLRGEGSLRGCKTTSKLWQEPSNGAQAARKCFCFLMLRRSSETMLLTLCLFFLLFFRNWLLTLDSCKSRRSPRSGLSTADAAAFTQLPGCR